MRAWRNREQPGPSSDVPAGPALAVGGLCLAPYDRRGLGAISLFGGMSAGIGMTVKLTGHNYLTAGDTAGHFVKGYIQRRAFNLSRVEAVIGAGARTEYRALDRHWETTWRCGPEIRVYSIGVRGFGLFRVKGCTNTGAKLATFAEYVSHARHPTITVSVTVGNFRAFAARIPDGLADDRRAA